MKRIKERIQRLLLFLLKQLNMPYNDPNTAIITNFLASRFIGVLQVNVSYLPNSSYSNANEISLDFQIDIQNGTFHANIKYYKQSQRIILNSLGNAQMPFNNLLTTVPLFTAPYLSFEQNKALHILPILQQMP